MITRLYKCELLSNIVLNSKTATEGAQKSLDYIPGSNFLGIAAAELYNQLKPEESYEYFHSGKVQFCDAHIASDNFRILKVPAAWFHEKGKTLHTPPVRIQHMIAGEELVHIMKSGIQLKQARAGYFDPQTGKLANVKKEFHLKSAHNRAERRSAESEMFGYESLQQGSTFIFKVKYDPSVNIKPIEAALTGNKRIGRSKTAQYGLVNISPLAEEQKATNERIDGVVVIYAESDFSFINEDNGSACLQPKPEQLGLPEKSTILWDQSQVLFRTYTIWNGKRFSPDADRIVIEKGSVILAQLPEGSSITPQLFEQGVGLYKAEGLGQVIINPHFLAAEIKTGILRFKLKGNENTNNQLISATIHGDNLQENTILDYLANKKQQFEQKDLALEIIRNFISKHQSTFREITPSQWGCIRDVAAHSKNKNDLFDRLFGDKGYLNHGIMLDLWETKGRKEILKEMIDSKFSSFINDPAISLEESKIPQTVEKLAAQMQKKIK